MKCPSCNEALPNNSNFCTNCGSVLQPLVSQQTNTTAPNEIAKINVWFEKGMKSIKGILGGDSGKVNRNMTIAFQLRDVNDTTTTCNGDVSIKVQLLQEYTWAADGMVSSGRRTMLNNSFQMREIAVHVSDYYRAGDGSLYWKYTHPNAFTIYKSHYLGGSIEIWFTPSGSKQILHKKDSYYIQVWE